MDKLEKLSIINNQMPWYRDDENVTKISSLNTRSLTKHLEDIKADHALLKSDIICLTETWVPEDTTFDYGIHGYNIFLNSIGKGWVQFQQLKSQKYIEFGFITEAM